MKTGGIATQEDADEAIRSINQQMREFKFDIGSTVYIHASGESGEVIGRSEHATCENQYNVRYKAADGRAVEAWWAESALS